MKRIAAALLAFESMCSCQLAFSTVGSWTVQAGPPAPLTTNNVVGLPDGRVAIFGGLSLQTGQESAQTVLFDPVDNTWTSRAPMPGPFFPDVVRALRDGTVLVEGGQDTKTSTMSGATWLYDPTANTWTNVTYSGGPQPRSDAGMAYVPELSASVLFGGQIRELYQPSPVLADTWIFDSFSYRWTELLPFNPPSARSGAGMAFVGNAHVALLYGGCDPTGCSGDTWWYDPAMKEWVERSSSAGPDFAPGAAFSYDPTGVVVAFGRSATWQYRAGADPGLAARPWASGVSEQTPETVAFHVAVTGGVPPYTYLWSFGDRARSLESDPVHAYVVAGIYHVSLRVRDANGISTVASFDVTLEVSGRGAVVTQWPAPGTPLAPGTVCRLVLAGLPERPAARP